MRHRPRPALFALLGLSATVLVSAQGRGGGPPPPAPGVLLLSAGASVGPGAEPGFGAFYYAMNGERTAPLEFLIVGVARDMNKKNDMLSTPPQRLGGPGRGRGL